MVKKSQNLVNVVCERPLSWVYFQISGDSDVKVRLKVHSYDLFLLTRVPFTTTLSKSNMEVKIK